MKDFSKYNFFNHLILHLLLLIEPDLTEVLQ